MPVDPTFRAFVEDQLAELLPVRTRRMFGGVGIYTDDLFFALVDDDVLYLKVDDTNRADFETRGCRPFQPLGPDTKPMSYWSVPGDLLEDPEALRPWVEKAVTVAKRGKEARRKPSSPQEP